MKEYRVWGEQVTMGLGSLKELYFDELSGLYDAEAQMIRALPRFMELARAPDLRELLQKHVLESRLHLERLQLIFTHWGERASARACAGITGIVQDADDRLNQPTTPDARDAAIIGAAQRMEHYEIASYGCARTYARRLNRADEARLLQETLDDEGRADRRLTEIAEAHINDDARSEQDLHEQRCPQLRHVASGQLDQSRLSREPLEVRNDADDDLGHFDGLLVDAPSGRPVYIIVDAGGLFVGRRFLLPVAHVRFDNRERMLRANLMKDVAERYPAFDPDEFISMNDEQVQRYEQRLRAFFPWQPVPESRLKPSCYDAADESLLDWLAMMTGVIPPARAARTTRAERSEAADRAITPNDR